MARLKDRQKQIPGGYKFRQPEMNYTSTPWASFDAIVNEVVAKRMANPSLVRRHGWATDINQVAVEVETYNVRLCQAHGWHDYIATGVQGVASTGGYVPPKRLAPLAALQNAAGGVKAIAEWDINGRVVTQEESAARAAICVTCPMNKPGELTQWFSDHAANAIKVQLEKRNSRRLFTPNDSNLDICDACWCPLKLKVHCPLDIIQKHMTPEAKARLDPRCWILKG